MRRPYLIAEIGINHNGDIRKAFELIDIAVEAGWDMVKFQKRDADVCVPEDQKNLPKMWKGKEMTYLEYKKDIEFGLEEYKQIRAYCNRAGINWTVSVWDLPSAQFMMENFKDDIPFIKIPSACITDNKLIDYFNKEHSDMPILISNGMSEEYEMDKAIEKIKNLYGVLHCNSSYPADKYELDLAYIPRLKEKIKHKNNVSYWNYPAVGYSGHEEDPLNPCLFAFAAGAEIIERHITYDKKAEGSDHKCSLQKMAMIMLREELEEVGRILGEPMLTIYPSEYSARKKLRRED